MGKFNRASRFRSWEPVDFLAGEMWRKSTRFSSVQLHPSGFSVLCFSTPIEGRGSWSCRLSRSRIQRSSSSTASRLKKHNDRIRGDRNHDRRRTWGRTIEIQQDRSAYLLRPQTSIEVAKKSSAHPRLCKEMLFSVRPTLPSEYRSTRTRSRVCTLTPRQPHKESSRPATSAAPGTSQAPADQTCLRLNPH
jgi:hypothetical protein